MRTYPVIMAGGSGVRLWPWSRTHLPKQFLNFSGPESLFTQTLRRASRLAGARETWVVLGEAQRHHARRIVDQYHIDQVRIEVEPASRNTAPAILLAAFRIASEDPDAMLAILPADHLVRPLDAFLDCANQALSFALNTSVVTIGITPAHAETGYGYLETEPSKNGYRKVLRFVEKPTLEKARDYLISGCHFWNSGMFFVRAEQVISLMAKHDRDNYQRVARYVHTNLGADYERCSSISFDYAVMEKHHDTQMVESKFQWSDLGSWQGVHQVSDRDPSNNAIAGDAVLADCEDSLVFARSRLVLGWG